ncbi:MAG TPA: FtsX-like permease family protein [Steroidobacteraceae bacterium]|nr:FtsX-like permease family protein [Steroidobacteraceae bacterium]
MAFPTLQFRPILSALKSHYIPASLIVLEIALTCAVLCNAVFMIGQRVGDIQLPNGIEESALSVVTVQGTETRAAADVVPRNVAALRGVSGVSAAAAVSSVPLDQSSKLAGFATTPEGKATVNSAKYFLGRDGAETLGLRLIEGRLFRDGEYADGNVVEGLPTSHVAVVTQSDARRLWPGEGALGKQIYARDASWTVVGVVADVLAQDPSFSSNRGMYSSVFFPVQPNALLKKYVLRSAPQDRERVLREGADALARLDPAAVLETQTYSQIRDDYFAEMSSMAWLLVLVCVVMLAVTIFGIVGLSSFWVQQRRRQIGVRRAVGATRGDILSYFLTENLILSAAGVVVGVALAYGINGYLLAHYEMQRMPWYFLPISAVLLCGAGQFAALGPALRATAVPPGEAIRS